MNDEAPCPDVEPLSFEGEAGKRLLRAIFGTPTEEDVLQEAQQMCAEDPPCEVCLTIARGGAHSEWLNARIAEAETEAVRAFVCGLPNDRFTDREINLITDWADEWSDTRPVPSGGDR